jgi:hypothetical protein
MGVGRVPIGKVTSDRTELFRTNTRRLFELAGVTAHNHRNTQFFRSGSIMALPDPKSKVNGFIQPTHNSIYQIIPDDYAFNRSLMKWHGHA